MSAARRHRRRQPNYRAPAMSMIAAAMAAGQVRPGTVHHVLVYHDDGCAQLEGRGPCDCDPDIRMASPDDPERN